MDDVRAAAQRGFTWLKEEGHRYDLDYRKIDLSTLDLLNNRLCILGQASDGLGYGLVIYKLRKDTEWASQHGFVTGIGDYHGPFAWVPISALYRDLTEVWVELLRTEERLSRAAMILSA